MIAYRIEAEENRKEASAMVGICIILLWLLLMIIVIAPITLFISDIRTSADRNITFTSDKDIEQNCSEDCWENLFIGRNIK